MDQITKTSPFKYPAKKGKKVCTQCLMKLPLDSFSKTRRTRTRSGPTGEIGYQSRCRACMSLYALKRKFKMKYGISWENYEKMYLDQLGLCFLCDEGGDLRLPNGRPRLLLDHHHASGQVRKLLCNTCNWRVGMLETASAEWMTRAMRYITDL